MNLWDHWPIPLWQIWFIMCDNHYHFQVYLYGNFFSVLWKCHWVMSLKVPCLKMHFWISDLARAVALFSKNVHDESLPTSIQTMSCKLLLNLVECIKDRSHKENAITNGRELLMRMNEVFVQKFKTVAKLQLVSTHYTQWSNIWKKSAI